MHEEELWSEAESVYAELVASGESALEHGLERLLRERPELAGRLRELHESYRDAERARRALELGPSVLDGARAGAAASGAVAASTEDELERLAGHTHHGRRLSLGRELGRGGMGRVLEAFDGVLGRTLALKRLREDRLPARAAGNEALRAHLVQRFLAEARLTAQLEHPGVVPVHDLGVDERGEPFYTMARIEGEDLGRVFEHARAERGGWTLARALEVLVRVAETLAHAHERGIVHRDVKPANVRVGRLGQVYVTDWGLARALAARAPAPFAAEQVDPARDDTASGGSPYATREGSVPGTPEYMAPEQAAGHAEQVGPRTDVYALGALLYELLGGRPPHPRGDSTPEELRRRAASEPPVALARLAPHAPAELVAIAERAMAREPAARYAGALELAADLRAFLAGRVVRAHRTGAWVELVKWTRRNRLAAGALGAALALLVGGLAATLVLRAEEREARLLAEERRIVAEQATSSARESAALAERSRLEAESQALRATEQARRASAAEAQVRERLAAAQVQSAELARQRGRWADVLAHVESAREAGWSDSVELDLRAAEALHAQGLHEESVALLEPLLARDDLGRWRGRVALERASLASEEYEAAERARSLVEEALAHELSAADRAYARALLEPTVAGALAALSECLSAEPSHHAAGTAQLVLLFFVGYHAEALERARTLRTFYPDDTMPDLVEALVHAFAGQEDEANEGLRRARERLPARELQDTEALVRLVSEARLALPAGAFLGEVREGSLGAERRIVGIYESSFSEASRALRTFRVPNLPCIAVPWGTGYRALTTLLAIDDALASAFSLLGKKRDAEERKSPWTRARPLFAEAGAASPEALFALFEGGCVMNDPERPGAVPAKLREAEGLYDAAARQPSLVPGVQRAARLWATLCELSLVNLEGDEAMRVRALEHVRAILAQPELIESERMWLATFGVKAEEPELALAAQRLGRGSRPASAEELRLQARLLELMQAPQNAERAWRKLLALEPHDAQALEALARLAPSAPGELAR